MNERRLTERIADRGGVDVETAGRIARATLLVLAERLPAMVTRLLADALPAEWGTAVRAVPGDEEFDLAAFHRRVAARASLPVGLAAEQARVVAVALAEDLPGELRRHLEVHLPAPFAALFEPPISSEPPPLPGSGRARKSGRSLSEGRPGSEHPVSEAVADRAQSGSVSRSDDPHAGEKLSGAHGRGSREGETLATGRPGSRRPLSEGREG